MSHRQSSPKLTDLLEEAKRKEWVNVTASSTKDEIIKEFLLKGKSPIFDANDWKGRPDELQDLAVQAKHIKVHMIVENSDQLEDSLKHSLRYIGKKWVVLK